VTTKNRAIVLFGPTAVGKTALTESLFSDGYEIINADSIQVYKGFDIGSAKPSEELMSRIRHHLVSIMDPHQQYTVGDFCHDAEVLIDEINKRGHIPLITGGTAYYFKELIYGSSKTPKADPAVREKVESLLKEKGKDYLYRELERLDIEAARKISNNDVYRITRALEIIYQSGRTLSSFKVSDSVRDDIDFLIIGLTRPKEELDRRISARVDIMFEDGFYDEIKRLFREGGDESWPAMQAIGYKEFLSYRESGDMTLSDVKKEIIRNSVKYAKRQMTFFKSFDGVHFINAEDYGAMKSVLASFL